MQETTMTETSPDAPSAPPAALAPRPARQPVPPDAHGWWWGTGRRKTAVARVRMRLVQDPAAGGVRVQKSLKRFKSIDEHFSEIRDRHDAVAPLRVTRTEGKFEIIVRLGGGGYMGQAQALRLGIARALRNFDPALEPLLREQGFLTRDAREVERKKYGQAGARRRFQFSKR
jgi:small subunit ribosomal protein S9